MRIQQLVEAPFVSEVGTDSCSNYVSKQWNSRYHWKYCQGTPCVDTNGHQSICIRPGAGKCICKRSQGEAPPPLNAKVYLRPHHEAQWLFEAPFHFANPMLEELNLEIKESWLFEVPDLMASHKTNKSRIRWDKHTKKRPGAPEKGDVRRTHGEPKPSEARMQASKKAEKAQQTLTLLFQQRHKALLAGQSFNVGQIDKAIEKTKKILNYWKQQVAANQEI